MSCHPLPHHPHRHHRIHKYRREAAARFSVGEDADGVVRGNYIVTETRPPILWRPAQTHRKIDALLRDTEQAKRRIDAWNEEAQRTLEHANAAVTSARTVEKEKRDALDAVMKRDSAHMNVVQ